MKYVVAAVVDCGTKARREPDGEIKEINWRKLVLFGAVALACHCVEAREEGPSPKDETLISLWIFCGGTVLVSLTLLALLWRPIDTAFRRSRFSALWEKRASRVAFALSVMVFAGLIVGGATYLRINATERAAHAETPPQLQPVYGGQVIKADRFALEMVARRTGEVRLYVTALQGALPSAWDINARAILPQSGAPATGKRELPMKVTGDFAYFVAYTVPFEVRELPVHLSVHILRNNYELDYNLPVQD